MEKLSSSYDPVANISDRSENTGQSLFVYIDEWDGGRLYLYIVVLLLIIWFFSKQNIGLNLIVALGVAYFVLSYMNHHTKVLNNTQQDIINIKEKSIKPKPVKALENTDIRDFLFSVQDFRSYNGLAYESMIKKIEEFFEYYNIAFIEPSRAQTYYGLMEQDKRDALNALASILLSMPEDKRVRAKLNRATTVLDQNMTKYLDHISYIADEYTYVHGYNVDTKIINYGPKPYNQYDDMFQPYSYDLF